jgi:hypothetical protein
MRTRSPLAGFALALVVAGAPLVAAAGAQRTEDPAPEPMPPQASAKLSLCHVDVDDEDPDRDAVTIQVSESAREAHLAHGDCVIEPPVPAGQECSPEDADDNDVCGDQSTP